jgi:hypothetical protein
MVYETTESLNKFINISELPGLCKTHMHLNTASDVRVVCGIDTTYFCDCGRYVEALLWEGLNYKLLSIETVLIGVEQCSGCLVGLQHCIKTIAL